MNHQEYIFTFGQGQTLEDCYVAIKAESSEAARAEMEKHYGALWAFQYDSREEAGAYRFRLKEVPLGTPNKRRHT
jgi:hypothetical protein